MSYNNVNVRNLISQFQGYIDEQTTPHQKAPLGKSEEKALAAARILNKIDPVSLPKKPPLKRQLAMSRLLVAAGKSSSSSIRKAKSPPKKKPLMRQKALWRLTDGVEISSPAQVVKPDFTWNTSSQFCLSPIFNKVDRKKIPSLKMVGELENYELPLTHMMAIDNATYYLSPMFYKNKHQYVAALVEVDGIFYQRIFYLSNSQGTWRVAPFALKRGGKIMQLGKGNHETDVQLPIQLTCALNSQITKAGKEGSETDFPFEDYIVAQNMQNLFPSFLKQVTASRRYGEGPSNNNNEVPDPRSAMLGAKKEPHEVRLPEDLERWPNFDHPLFQGPCYLPLLGDVTLRVYDSEDGKCRFLFVEADDGRAFLAGVERLTSEINKYGVRSKYFQPSGADAPLVEYYCQTQADCRPKSEAPCYNTAIFNVGRKKDGRYISNWNFVRALPIIQEYYKARQEEIPDTV